jgi:hypothetical protein
MEAPSPWATLSAAQAHVRCGGTRGGAHHWVVAGKWQDTRGRKIAEPGQQQRSSAGGLCCETHVGVQGRKRWQQHVHLHCVALRVLILFC